MNHLTRRIGIAGCALFFALPLLAQGPRGFGPGGQRGPGGGDRIEFLAGYLNLTETQKTQAETIFAAAKTASESARGSLESARESLSAAVKGSKTETEINALAASVGTLQGNLLGISSNATAKFRAILTPEQIEKLDSRERRRGPGEE